MSDETEFVDKIKQGFDDSVRDLDAGTAARITQCRSRALAGGGRSLSPLFRVSAGAVATVCLTVLVYVLLPRQAEQPPSAESQPATVLEQMEMISDLELYEDLEFYQWLEQHELPS